MRHASIPNNNAAHSRRKKAKQNVAPPPLLLPTLPILLLYSCWLGHDALPAPARVASSIHGSSSSSPHLREARRFTKMS